MLTVLLIHMQVDTWLASVMDAWILSAFIFLILRFTDNSIKGLLVISNY